MATTYPIRSSASLAPSSETDVIRSTHTILKYLFSVVPVVAGADKFTHVLAQWESYLNPAITRVLPVPAATLMGVVGGIEIVAGVLVFLRPRLGGYVVMGWLLAIAVQLLLWGHFLDVAVRDIVIALSGPLILARLTPYVALKNTNVTD